MKLWKKSLTSIASVKTNLVNVQSMAYSPWLIIPILLIQPEIQSQGEKRSFSLLQETFRRMKKSSLITSKLSLILKKERKLLKNGGLKKIEL